MEKTLIQTRAKHLLADKEEIQKNIELFHIQNPSAALYLDHKKMQSTFSLTKLKELNLIVVEKGKRKTLYSPTGALQQTKEWVQGIPLDKIQALYVLGVGLGYEYEVLKNWLEKDPKRRVVFLEYDPEKMDCFLETKHAHEILTHPQIKVVFFKDLNDPVFMQLTWDNFRVEIDVYATHFYLKRNPELYQILKHKLYYDSSFKNRNINEYLNGSPEVYEQIYKNILELPHSVNGQSLLGKFKDVPAIICGAGPSLKRNARVLKKLKNKALIFGGGSALNGLLAQGVVPHFGLGVDPNNEQVKRLEKSHSHEVPFFYKNRMHHDAFKKISGPKLYLKGVGGYPVSEWLEEKLGIEGPVIEGGLNVVNLSAELAIALGCNPLIFVGCDLAFTSNHVYAPGVESIDRKIEKDAPIAFGAAPIKMKDIKGKKTLTLWKWIAESQWLAELSKAHPEVTMINSTQGGIGIPGVPNIPLKEVMEGHLQTKHGIKHKIDIAIQSSKLPDMTKAKVVEALKELRDSLKRCAEHLKVLIDDPDSSLAIVAEVELVEEDAYKAVLETFDQIFKHLFMLKAQGREAEYNKERLKYLFSCAQSNMAIINKTLA